MQWFSPWHRKLKYRNYKLFLLHYLTCLTSGHLEQKLLFSGSYKCESIVIDIAFEFGKCVC
jgi:hypothetical protein